MYDVISLIMLSRKAGTMGTIKRRAALPDRIAELHRKWSKATIHEALLDLWLEAHALDIHPNQMSDEQNEEYRSDVERRAALRQGQG